MDSSSAPTRLRASREIGICKAMRYELGRRVANPSRHPDMIGVVDEANKTV